MFPKGYFPKSYFPGVFFPPIGITTHGHIFVGGRHRAEIRAYLLQEEFRRLQRMKTSSNKPNLTTMFEELGRKLDEEKKDKQHTIDVYSVLLSEL